MHFARPVDEVLRGKIERFRFQAGVLEDRIYKLPGHGMKSLAGKKVRRVSGKASGMTISQVSASARKKLRFNYLTAAFKEKNRKNADAMRMMRVFWDLVFKQGKISSKRRLENSIQAVLRNPLTRADYGRNKRTTAKIKGSNRKFIDTGQLFKALTAKVRIGSGRRG
jgi:hypothetical protein